MQALPVRPVTLGAPLGRVPATVTSPADGPAKPKSAWNLGAAQLDGTGVLFCLYLLLIFLEFTGLPNQYAILKVTRLSTIISYSLVLIALAKAGLTDVLANRSAKLLIGFFVFTVLSVLWAFIRLYAINSIRPLVDYLGLMIITGCYLDRRSRMNWFAATFSLIAVWLVGLNFEKLTSGGPRIGHFEAPYFMGDGNDLAWWLALALPFALSLVFGKCSWLQRGIGAAGAAACLVGVMGTTSRGAFMGLGSAFLYGWLFVSKKKALGTILVVAVALVMLVIAPSGYFARMNTVTNYQEDNSAQSRIKAWTAGLHMAMDHPLGVGAGNFSSVNGRYYLNQPGRWFNAHSIYFKVLGEYGFLGLAMLLATILSLLQLNGRSRRAILANPEDAPLSHYWPGFLNMSVIAFALCGVFLGGFNYPHLFVLTGLCIATQRVIRLESTGGTGETSRAPVSAAGAIRPGVAPIATPARRPV